MQTVRRFLVLTPVAVVVTTVAYVIYLMVGPDSSIDLRSRAARNAVSPAA